MKPNTTKAKSGPTGFLQRVGQARQENFQTRDQNDQAIIELNAGALQKNYQAIADLAPGQWILPMLKANAYGHGAAWVAKILVSMPDLYGFGVATLEEGVEVRVTLGSRHRKVPVIVFSGATPWSTRCGEVCESHALTPVITSAKDWNEFIKDDWPSRISYELQFDTGMNRLGIHPAFAKSIIKSCSKFQTQNYPQGIFSHLAASEAPDSKLTLSQIQSFQALKKELGAFFTTSKFHLANSGGIWNAKNLSLQNGMTDVIRPGLSLYGIPPGPEAPHRSLASVMTFRARVIAIHRLKQGDSIGYLGTYRVSSPQAVYAAILPVGYADGVVRALSNTGHAWVNEKPTRFLGNVSMDLCAVQCFEGTQVGDLVELIGPHVDAWAQAKAAGTIPYELFTSLSPRVRRTYS